MGICKLPPESAENSGSDFDISPSEFIFKEGKVQGAALGKTKDGKVLLVEGAARFKLFSEGIDLVKILEGNGHFKWKRGETDFSAGDCFQVEDAGEYEINGSPKFLVVRR